MISGEMTVRNNSMRAFISAGLSAWILRTTMPGYFSGGYKRILAKSKSRLMMILFSANARAATTESGESGGKMSLISTTVCPSASITALVERGMFASIRKSSVALLPVKRYFFFPGKHGCIGDTRPDIFVGHRRIFGLDFFIGHSRSKGIEDDKNRDSRSFNTGFPVADSWVYGYSLKRHHLFKDINFRAKKQETK